MPRQPFPSVHADLDVEGEPRLQACAHEAKDRIDEVLVEVQALARIEHQTAFVAVLRSAVLECPARFQSREDADQPLLNGICGQNLSGKIFLTVTRGGQISDRTLEPFSVAERCPLHPLCGLDREALEVDQLNPGILQEVVHPELPDQRLQNPVKDDPVEARQHTSDERPIA